MCGGTISRIGRFCPESIFPDPGGYEGAVCQFECKRESQ